MKKLIENTNTYLLRSSLQEASRLELTEKRERLKGVLRGES